MNKFKLIQYNNMLTLNKTRKLTLAGALILKITVLFMESPFSVHSLQRPLTACFKDAGQGVLS
jgi:hypothetical protein